MSILVAKEKLLDEGVYGVFTPSSPPILERSVRWLKMPLGHPRSVLPLDGWPSEF